MTDRDPPIGRRPASLRWLWRDASGAEVIELTLVLPLLLVIVFGLLEFGSVFDVQHTMAGLSREGANIASRGASLDSVVQVTAANGDVVGVSSAGAVVASRIDVQGGVPRIVDQRTAGGMTVASRIGPVGQPAGPFVGGGLGEGKSYHVVEIFVPYRPFTPLRGFVAPIIPDTLYERSIF